VSALTRRVAMVELIQGGLLPPELYRDAILACEEQPPRWRVFRRAQWERAVERVIVRAVSR
jgi:hypothetical protein